MKKTKVTRASAQKISPKDYRPRQGDLQDASGRAMKIFSTLRRSYPDAHCALDRRNTLELLIATILSAQCTDVRVNIVTRSLFKKYRKADNYADAPDGQLENDIKTTGFYRNKARNIRAACRDIVEKFAGKVPDNMDDLLSLSGVGRKTANVVLGNAFDIPGVVTDTHVIRLSRLMGLSANTEPVKLEYDLMELLPPKNWTLFSHVMVFHGRQICIARKPGCNDCPVRRHCCYGRSGL